MSSQYSYSSPPQTQPHGSADVFSFLLPGSTAGSDQPAISVQAPSEASFPRDDEQDEQDEQDERASQESNTEWRTTPTRKSFIAQLRPMIDGRPGVTTVLTLSPERYAGAPRFRPQPPGAASASEGDAEGRGVRTDAWHSLLIAPRNELLSPTSPSRCVLTAISRSLDVWHSTKCSDGECLGWGTEEAVRRYATSTPYPSSHARADDDDDDHDHNSEGDEGEEGHSTVKCNPWNPYTAEGRTRARLQAKDEEKQLYAWERSERTGIKSGVDPKGYPTTEEWQEEQLEALEKYVDQRVAGIRWSVENGGKWGWLESVFASIDHTTVANDVAEGQEESTATAEEIVVVRDEEHGRSASDASVGSAADDFRTQTVEMRLHAVRPDLDTDSVPFITAIDRTHRKFCSSVWCPGSRSLREAISHSVQLTEDDLRTGKRCRPDLEWPFARDERGRVIELYPGDMVGSATASEASPHGSADHDEEEEDEGGTSAIGSRADWRSPRRLEVPSGGSRPTSLSPSPGRTRRWLPTRAWVREVQRMTGGLSLQETPTQRHESCGSTGDDESTSQEASSSSSEISHQ